MLRARVRHVKGTTAYLTGTMRDGKVVNPQRHPDPDYLEIVEQDNGYYVFHFLDSQPDACISDDWFESMEQALRHARFEYGITKDDWHEIP